MQHGRLSSLALSASLLLVGATACDGGGTGGSGGTGGGGAGGAGGGGAGGIGGGGAGGAADVPVTVAFGAKVGAEDFSCSVQFSNLGTTGATATLLDLRFYVHDVRLLSGAAETPITLDEDAFQLGDVALLDFEDKSGTCANGTTEVNTSIRGTAPAGAYDGVRFRLGLPFEQNHQDKDQASSPLNLSALFWDWQAGYKFVRADAREKDAATPFNFHLGSTGCDGDPVTGGTTQCSRENVVEITLSPFDPATDVVVFDYAALVAGVDLIADGGGAPGCMSGTSDPECGAMFDALGIDIATGAIDPSAQLVFSVQ